MPPYRPTTPFGVRLGIAALSIALLGVIVGLVQRRFG
jgi:hypothetical protein